MNLKWHLITRIWLLALLCLLVACGHVLWQTDREQRRHVEVALDAVSNQVLNRFAAASMGSRSVGFDSEGRFLSWDTTVLGTDLMPGVCVRYLDPAGNVHASNCRYRPKTTKHIGAVSKAPDWFTALYTLVVNPGRESVRTLSGNGREIGKVTATLDSDNQSAEAWHDINALIGLTVGTVFALCLLVYFVVSHALRPTREILAGLQRLERGDLGARLPQLRLRELQKMSDGFNRLAASLEHSIAQRADLTRKLVTLQEEERRYLSRELHDEFGQCLAAINAVAASVTQTAEEEHPALAAEGRRLSRIAGDMMQALRDILNRLRPAGIDELGLLESIQGLVAEYDNRGARIELTTRGEFGHLSQAIAVSVYRIVQECLTNVSKHAGASHVSVVLERVDPAGVPGAGCIEVTVEDDGKSGRVALARGQGLGLLGMHERVTALGGELGLRVRDSGGLSVHARIPLLSAA